ncbi:MULTISPECIES: aminopeptidase 1 [Dethiosulfovibrio]|uniref:M18 family aminopeptidase n=2 Tax=Dethiosulfovibrio TaxID=47054 RepID=A0ABS9EL99_9BACT|nr:MULTISPECIES: aminopeptidase 1 [Dethiosulfovibrio]MCF4113517.1 aminopeptidase 1 [Dethiosulfovibrio russensis]MCF4141987.1 aminopeptidase 1 [Dethiosulfovibrio marinus]MCF4144142.1 aminopeptidase 1 [Dethiosulfovibrio acidaminovorans]MEA3284252.1 aminopeptidase 1 [Synergistota bacterium]
MTDKKTKKDRTKSWTRYGKVDMTESLRFLMDTVTAYKTEREWVRWLQSDLERKGSKEVIETSSLEPGDTVHMNWKGRALLAAKVGRKGLSSGVTVIASHIDSPRVDVKSRPLYEEGNLALLDCHYYGGLKKYQWTNVPLALHGEIHRGDGTSERIVIGEDSSEPVLMIPDLEPHVDRDMAKRKASETVVGEDLDAIVGHRPIEDDEIENPIKESILSLLKDRFAMDEQDFLSADLALVPAGPARLAGLDESMVSSYGLDDRICTSMSYKAFCDMETPDKTAIFVAVDREEIGSESIGGIQGTFLDLFLLELLRSAENRSDILSLRRLYSESCAISADVTSGMNPLYKKNYVRDQQALIGNGVGVVKFTGSGGKYDGNEARGEFVAAVVACLDRAEVPWQTGGFGTVDKAGGGTIAKYLARTGMDTLDMGPALLSMHAPMEIASVADVEALYRSYIALWTDLEQAPRPSI